jgi:DNA-binding MarR family transcriptional regulator
MSTAKEAVNESKAMKVRVDFEPLHESLGFLLNHIARLMRSELEYRLQAFNLTPTTWTVMVVLLEQDRQSQRDIAEHTALDNATITRALDLLEAREYISRNRPEEDRRVQIIALTPEGRKAGLSAVRCGQEINKAAIEFLMPEEREVLPGIIGRLRIRMQTIVGERSANELADQSRAVV